MVFFLGITKFTNIWSKFQYFWFTDFFLEILKIHRLVWIFSCFECVSSVPSVFCLKLLLILIFSLESIIFILFLKSSFRFFKSGIWEGGKVFFLEVDMSLECPFAVLKGPAPLCRLVSSSRPTRRSSGSSSTNHLRSPSKVRLPGEMKSS